MRDPIQDSGLFASLSRLLATVLQMAQVRLQLLGTEVELEKRRVFDGLLWGAVALVVVALGLVLMCGFIILLFWEGYRLAATGGLMAIFLIAGLLMLRYARNKLSNRTAQGMFDTSLDEIKRDQTNLNAGMRDGTR